MSDLTAARVRRIVADLFSVDEATVGPATSPADVSKWTSMGHVMLMLEIEQSFGVQLSAEQMENARSVGDIVAGLRASGVGSAD